MTPSPLAVAIVSGGMDSVTLAYDLAAQGYRLHLISVDYGQRHVRELDYAGRCASALDAAWDVIDLTSITKLLTGSALTDPTVQVPDGHYAEPTMRITVVPNRNATMLCAAAAVAVAEGAELLATGVHAGDHAVYPDCRPEFIDQLDRTLRIANEGFLHPDFRLSAPYVQMGKHDIAALGDRLGVPWDQTWSCYKGGEYHCGTCGTCTERIEAFDLARVTDPTRYERP